MSPSPPRRYICSRCQPERAFTTAGHLARHIRVHTGERRYRCPFHGCETRCGRKDNLEQHFRIHLPRNCRRGSGAAVREQMRKHQQHNSQHLLKPTQTTSLAHHLPSINHPTPSSKPHNTTAPALPSLVGYSQPIPALSPHGPSFGLSPSRESVSGCFWAGSDPEASYSPPAAPGATLRLRLSGTLSGSLGATCPQRRQDNMDTFGRSPMGLEYGYLASRASSSSPGAEGSRSLNSSIPTFAATFLRDNNTQRDTATHMLTEAPTRSGAPVAAMAIPDLASQIGGREFSSVPQGPTSLHPISSQSHARQYPMPTMRQTGKNPDSFGDTPSQDVNRVRHR